MQETVSAASLKQQAKALRRLLRDDFKIDITHSQSLEKAAALHGFANWDTAAATLAEKKCKASEPVDHPVQISQLFALRTGLCSGRLWPEIVAVLCEQNDSRVSTAWQRVKDVPLTQTVSIADLVATTGLFDEMVVLLLRLSLGSSKRSEHSLHDAIGYLQMMMGLSAGHAARPEGLPLADGGGRG